MPEWFGSIIAGAITIFVFGAIKWLISDWYKKSKELQNLRTENTRKELKQANAAIVELKSTVTELEENLKSHKVRLESTDKKITEHTRVIEKHTEEMKAMKSTLKDFVSETVRSEILILTDRLRMIREKKPDGKKGDVGKG